MLDDEPWRTAPAEAVREAGLRVGDEATVTEFESRLAGVEPRLARDRAVRLLTYRDRSSAELASKLDDDGYLPDVVSTTVARFVDLGLVDDDRFARSLARNLTQNKGLGRGRASREMIARGVDPASVADILDEALPPEDEERAALALARASARRAGATRERVAARLMRKGYAPRIALSAAREACETDPERAESDAWDTTDSTVDGDVF